MGLARNLARSIGRGLWTRLLDRVGGRLVATFADTSSDAPGAFHRPKRHLYEELAARQGGTLDTESSDR